jgi:hypothetical protein
MPAITTEQIMKNVHIFVSRIVALYDVNLLEELFFFFSDPSICLLVRAPLSNVNFT